MSWNAKYVTLILFTTVISFFAALIIEETLNKNKLRQTKLALILSIITCLSMLVIFKYCVFFFEIISSLCKHFSLQLHPITLKLVLPIGISFYTFQTVSYIVDVYRGEIKAEHNFIRYAAYISFFPQLVAGPIERAKNLLPQLKEEHHFNYSRALYGLKLMSWGYFKKIVIADNIAVFVDNVYNNLTQYDGFALLLATLLFSCQIYCVFSGYSDIACGTANLLDIELMQNFKAPYFSTSVKEFWNRWHISLSTWLRDYIYIPLGGSRTHKIHYYLNILITFLISGLWHGANYTFIAWGAVHGSAIVFEIIIKTNILDKIKLLFPLRIAATFSFITLAWVLFRAQNLHDAIFVYSHIFNGISNPNDYIHSGLEAMTISTLHILFGALFLFLPLLILDYKISTYNYDVIKLTESWDRGIQYFFFVVIGLTIIFLSKKDVAAEFVYFQF